MNTQEKEIPEYFPLQNPESDSEMKPNLVTMTIAISYVKGIGTRRFEHFPIGKKLVIANSTLRHVAVSFHQN